MPSPEFTREERYVLDSIKMSDVTGGSNVFMWSYITGGITLAAFAAYHDSIPMMASAFAGFTVMRLYEERWSARWTPVWRSIIEKYETVLAESEKQHHSVV